MLALTAQFVVRLGKWGQRIPGVKLMCSSIRSSLLVMALVIPFGLACGDGPDSLLEDPSVSVDSSAVKIIASFDDRNPFSGGVVVAARTPEGRKALRIDRSYVSMEQRQNWADYDFLKADLDSDAKEPMNLDIEIRDAGTRDYWTRVNYTTVAPPEAE